MWFSLAARTAELGPKTVLQVETPFPGILRYPRFMALGECDALLKRGEAAGKWTAAAIGRYQDNRLVEQKVDTDLRDVEVCDLEQIGFQFPTSEVEELRQDIVRRLDVLIDIMSR